MESRIFKIREPQKIISENAFRNKVCEPQNVAPLVTTTIYIFQYYKKLIF